MTQDMTQDRVQVWLAAFDRALPLRGQARRRARAELEAHLMDAAAAAEREGATDPGAQAVQQVGDPTVVAAGFRRRERTVVALAVMLWLPAAIASTICVGTSYVIGQQVLRTGANDPQIQIAQDDAARLSAGTPATQVATGPVVDVGSSLATTVIVFDRNGAVLASTARLDGTVPTPPPGVLRSAGEGGGENVTWQPRPGVRQAAVAVHFTGPGGAGTVVVSRSLRLVEQREKTLQLLGLFGWALAVLVSAAVALVVARVVGPGPGAGPGRAAWATS